MGENAKMKKKFRNFKDARKFVRKLKLKNTKDWLKYCKSGNKPNNIPTNPQRDYKKDWISWMDWLGTKNISVIKMNFRNFKDARKFVRKLKLKNTKDWLKYCKSGNKPDDIPTHPERNYKNEWQGWGNFLGNENIASQYLSKKYLLFNDARKFVHLLNIKNTKDWLKYCKSGNKPDDIPAYPRQAYKNNGWISMGDWLGNKTIASQNKTFIVFKKARKIIQSFKFQNVSDWLKYCKSGDKPDNIPTNPDKIYKNKGWISMGDWLGTVNISTRIISQNWLPWPQAKLLYRKIGKENNLKNSEDWKKYIKTHKLPKGLPSTPSRIYTKERVWKRMQK